MKWIKHGLAEAELIAKMSKDPSRHVGCYITDSNHRPVSKGFNGLPRGIEDKPERFVKPLKLALTIHAEMNAILFAERDKLVGATLYCTHIPCSHCAICIIQAGISKVIFYTPDAEFLARWGEHTLPLFEEAGIHVLNLDKEKYSGN